jgi:IclR family acetate operon transcriptional repressor
MQEHEAAQRSGVESVRRATRLLRCFTIEQPEWGVMDLSRKLGVHKSTVSRLLSTLENERLVMRNPETGRYHLGVGILELAGLVTLHGDLRRSARPYLDELARLTQETANLAVREGDHVVNIEHTAPLDRRVLNFGWVGRRTPVHASATGKVLLAYAPLRELENLLTQPLDRFTEHTITDHEALLQELERVRQRGYATGLEELEVGLHAVAAPVRAHDGEVVAAVSTAGPSNRLTRRRIKKEVANQVLAVGEEISRMMGFIKPKAERRA